MAIKDDNGLPPGWTRATIVDLIASDGVFIDGDWVESKDQDPNGDVRLIQLADVGDGRYRDKSNRFMTTAKANGLGCTFLKSDDILIARMPDPLGRSCLFPGDSKPSVTVVDVCIVRTGKLGADHRWLMHAVNSPLFRADVASLQSGSTRKRISRGNLATLELPVPPLPEQHRIVSKTEELLTRLDAGVHALNAVKAQLRRYRQSVLKSAFEGKLTAEWREAHKGKLESASVLLERIKEERKKKLGGKFKDHPHVNDFELPKLPAGWKWVRMDETCNKIQDGTHFSPKLQYPGPGPRLFKYVTAKNIREKGLDLRDLTYIDEAFHKSIYSRCNPEKGDVLLTKDGVNTGVAAINTLDEEFSILSSVALLKPEKVALRGQYLRYFLNSPMGFRLVTGKMTGTAIKRIIMEKLRPCEFPLAPIEEQDQVVSEIERLLSVTEAMVELVDQSLAQSERLRNSILKQAFEGKLVPQDPNDPPASELLERIRMERESGINWLTKKVKKGTTASR